MWSEGFAVYTYGADNRAKGVIPAWYARMLARDAKAKRLSKAHG